MAEQSLLDMAAEVRARRKELDGLCDLLKGQSSDWSTFLIAADAAEGAAIDGIRNTWRMLELLCRLARSAAKPQGEPT